MTSREKEEWSLKHPSHNQATRPTTPIIEPRSQCSCLLLATWQQAAQRCEALSHGIVNSFHRKRTSKMVHCLYQSINHDDHHWPWFPYHIISYHNITYHILSQTVKRWSFSTSKSGSYKQSSSIHSHEQTSPEKNEDSGHYMTPTQTSCTHREFGGKKKHTFDRPKFDFPTPKWVPIEWPLLHHRDALKYLILWFYDN